MPDIFDTISPEEPKKGGTWTQIYYPVQDYSLTPWQREQEAKKREVIKGDIFDRLPPLQPSILSRVKDVGLGTLETGVSLATGLAAYPIGLAAQAEALVMGFSVKEAREVREFVSKTYTYLPTTESGKVSADILGRVISIPFYPSEKVREYLTKKYGPEIGEAAGLGAEAATVGLMGGLPRLIGKLKKAPQGPTISDVAIERPLEIPKELGKPSELKAEIKPEVKVEVPLPEIKAPISKPDIFDKIESKVTLNELVEKPSLADYVLKRPEIHDKEAIDFANKLKGVEGKKIEIPPITEVEKVGEVKPIEKPTDIAKEENALLSKSYQGDLTPEEVNRLKTIRFEKATEIKETELPKIEIKKGIPPTEPLTGEKVSKEAMPVSKGGVEKEDILSWVRSKGGIDPDTVSADVFGLTQKESGFRGRNVLVKKGGRPLDELAQEWGWERGGEISTDDFTDAIKSAVEGTKKGERRPPGIGATDQEIEKYIADQERKYYQERQGIYESDPELLKEETINKLTKIDDNEIIGLKEEWREQGYSESKINEFIRSSQKDIEAEKTPTDIEGIKKDLGITESKLPLEERVAKLERAGYPEEAKELRGTPSPTRKGETLLPGMKVGLEMKGGKEVTPTLEGTPLMEAAKKVEQEKIQPSLLKSEKGAISLPTPEEIKRATRRFREFWKPLSTLPQREKLMGERGKAMGDMARAERIVEKSVKLTKNLSDQQKIEIFEAMDGRRDPATMAPEDAKIVNELRVVNEIVGKMLVKRDLISDKAYQKHKGQYIKYAYLKHVLGNDIDIPVKPNGKINTNALKARKDLTLEQRKAIGLIEDVSIAEPLGLAQSLGNVVKYDYLEQLASDPRNVWTPSIVNISDLPREYPQKIAKAQATRLTRQTGDPHGTFQLPNGNWAVKNMTTKEFVGKRMGIGELSEEVELYQRMVKENPNSPELAQRLQVYEKYLNQAKQATQNVPEDFIQMPTAKSWGPLAGSFIRKEIARDLTSFYGKEKTNIEGLSKLVDVLSSIDAKATGIFKIGKVPLNLPTVVRNTISNMIQMNMKGMNPVDIMQSMVKAGDAMLNKSPEYTKAYRHGLFKTNWSVEEINEVMSEFRHLQGDSWAEIIGAVRNVSKYYGKIDDFFKMAIYLDERGNGSSVIKSVNEAQKWGMDYSLADPSIKWARKHAIPFVSYQYKIAPLIVESAIRRPWVIGKYLATPYLIGQAVREIYKGQMTEDDWKTLEKTIPQEVTRRQSYMLVPWKIHDKWYWFDYSYFLPWGNYVQAISGLAEGDIKSPLTQFGVGGTPMITLAKTYTSSAIRNEPPRDAFSGYPIYNQLDDPLEKALKTSENLYNLFGPSMLSRYGALGYTFDIGKEDRYGRQVPAEQAVGKWVGVNLKEANPKLAAIVMKAKINALKDEYMKIMLDPNLSQERREKYARRFQIEIQNITGSKSEIPKEEVRQPIP